MKTSSLSIRCGRALAVLGCTLALATQARPAGLKALRGHVPPPASRAKLAGPLAETNRLRLALGLPLRHQDELAALLRELYDPSGAKFHQFLTPAEFTARFGPTEEDYAAVTAFAKSHGLRVVQTHANRLLLDVEGAVADVQEAFHVKMNVFQHPAERRTFYAPAAEPSVEGNLPLLHISGLDNYLLPKPMLITRSGPGQGKANTGSGPGGTFIGRDFRAAYAPGVYLDGAGQSVALVEFDTFISSDITAYETMANLPHVPVATVPVDGFSAQPDGGENEVSLDIELSISMAPGLAQVIVYEAPYGSTSVNDDLLSQMAEDDLANQIACCWVFAIDATTDFIFQEMAAQGQSFFAASGDAGAYYVDIPALEGDANITVVGGTTLTTTGPGGAWVAERVWNWFSTGSSGAAASSGGVSSTAAIPYWQMAVNMSSNQGSTFWRNVPDVSMTGDNIILISSNGQTIFGGGTSVAAPLWAGFTAMINQQAAQYGRAPAGFLNPAIYGAAQSALYPSLFHDITTGNNTNSNGSTEFFAVPGYDLCTGWGTPMGRALIDTLAPPDSLVLAPRGGLSFAVTNGLTVATVPQSLVLKNTEATIVNWALGPYPSWVSVSLVRGAVAAGLIAPVTVGASRAAESLPPGNYMADLLVTNLTAGVTHSYPVFLQVWDPLIVAPNSGWAVTGPVGGPFDASSQTFSLSNVTSVPIDWTAQSTSAFAAFTPAGGSLPAHTAIDIAATLNPAASNLLIGAQAGNLLFADLNTSTTQSQPFTLNVGNGGFETGDFSDWTFAGMTWANFVAGVLPFLDYIHSGEYAALLGEPTNTASLSQTLPTVPGQLYLVSLFLDNPVGGPPNEFQVQWGGATLFDQVDVPQMPWTNIQFAVFATNATTTLELVFRNDPDAFGLDDISVTPIAPPAFSAIAASNGAILFNWSATPGFRYRLQYTTDLSAPLWVNSGAPITATNGVATAADPQPADAQRFYRVELVSP